VLLGTLLPLVGCVPIPGTADAAPQVLSSWLRGLFPDPAAAAAIGSRYLRSRPAERSAEGLAQHLFGRDLSAEIDSRGFEQLMRGIAAGRVRDYRDDDLIILDGWSVTRTEARLLALVALCTIA
jgi:hypothetical protein